MFSEIAAAEREILKLMSRHPFRAPGDLSDWVLRHAAAAVIGGREPQDPNLVAEITAQLMKDPNSPFDFSVGLNNESEQSYRATLSEDLVLEVRTEVHDDGSVSDLGAELRGKVSAYSHEVAVEESCRVIREVIGALLAVGLASKGWLFTTGDEPDFELTGGLVRSSAHPGDRVIQQLVRLWQDGSDRPQEIRTACGLYARAEVATDPGVAVINYSMCLEGLLLDRTDKDNVIARLTEAMAYRLGKSADDRERLRKLTRSLYGLRSEYVHTGRFQADFERQEGWARTASEALRREIEDF
jgi:hypothetical protein